MMISSITGYGNLFIIHKEFNMHFELDKYKETLDQRFVNENLTPVNDGEQIKIFHASVWIEALLKIHTVKMYIVVLQDMLHLVTRMQAVLMQKSTII